LNSRVLAYLDSHSRAAARNRDAAAQGGIVAAQGFSPANTVVLLHAFPLHADMWQPQLEAVPSGWRFVAPDLRGFGNSPVAAHGPAAGTREGAIAAQDNPEAAQDFSPANASLDDYAADILALLDHLDVSSAVVAGLSMGGYLAMALCRLAPSRVRGLVLANTKAEGDTAEGRTARTQMMARVAQAGPFGLADEMLPRLLGETTRRRRPEVVAHVRAMAAGNAADGVLCAIGAMMRRPDSTALLAGLACPALVIASDEDVITPPVHAQAMHQALRSSALVRVPAAGHLSNLERPDRFNAALHRFLEALTS
jgi:pimeloyl-ACP methyl ester carboxylesterase